MDRALRRLPANLAQWSRTSREQALIGGNLLELRQQYQEMVGHPAWQHFQGMLLSLKEKLEQDILMGSVNRKGEDLTPLARSAYGIVLQILAIPAQIESRTLSKEMEANLQAEELQLEEDLTFSV